jgi:hypothetical protein
MKPKAGSEGADYAKTPEDIQSHYERSSEPVPIFVDYRRIPGRGGQTEHAAWADPIAVEFKVDNFLVQVDGSTVGSTRWNMSAYCTVNSQEDPDSAVVIWDNNKVQRGESYTTTTTVHISAFDGDRVRCFTRGKWKHQITRADDNLAPGGMSEEWTAHTNAIPVSGSYEAKDAATGYVVKYTIRVVGSHAEESPPLATQQSQATPLATPSPAVPAVPLVSVADVPKRHHNKSMRVAGIFLTSVGSLALATGGVLVGVDQAQGGATDDMGNSIGGLGTMGFAGVGLMAGSALFAGIGVPLWVVGGKEDAVPLAAIPRPRLVMAPHSGAIGTMTWNF